MFTAGIVQSFCLKRKFGKHDAAQRPFCVVHDILSTLDNDISILLLLDLSEAFDTTDHQILLSRLNSFFLLLLLPSAFSLMHSSGFSHISQTDISPLLSITRLLHHRSSRTVCLRAQYCGPFSSSCILHLSLSLLRA